MFVHPALLVSAMISSAGLSVAVAPLSEITAAPVAPTAAVPDPGLSYSLSCSCETIPYLTTTFCLPCSTVYFTGTTTASTSTGTA
ncbi:hypothetical protein C8R47DRAFT_1167687 [Mycena vitilis]|nr:hypothetical protein C8R47DRAFT_1167687 [Mycena vitilis]